MFIDGTGSIYGKGMKRPRPGRTRVVFGSPMRPEPDESTRRFNTRIHAAVTALADEATTDWWTARRRAAGQANPSLGGPDYTGWRRQWDLSKRRRQGIAGWRQKPPAGGPIWAELVGARRRAHAGQVQSPGGGSLISRPV